MRLNTLFVTAACALLTAPQAIAQPNEFFGGSVPQQAPPGVDAAAQHVQGGDYTDDEKHMQKKYKSSINRAKQLIAKGDKMMKDGEAKHDNKMAKKGKIFKEIGEKQLAELQANNPFPDLKETKRQQKDNKAGL